MTDPYRLTLTKVAGAGISPALVATLAPVDPESLNCPEVVLVFKADPAHALLKNRLWLVSAESTIPAGLIVPCQISACPRPPEES